MFEATLNSKLMYCLESIQLTTSEQDTLDSFQMKMLRRILRVPSTCIDREGRINVFSIAWCNSMGITMLDYPPGGKVES